MLDYMCLDRQGGKNMAKFYKCVHCGNIVEMIEDKGVPILCCGEPMKEIVANSTEAATEKHIPVVTTKDNVVEVVVSSVEHPMTEEHSIQWIVVETTAKVMRHSLKPTDAPKAAFVLAPGEQVVAVYEYCNLHGLWKA